MFIYGTENDKGFVANTCSPVIDAVACRYIRCGQHTAHRGISLCPINGACVCALTGGF